MATVLVDVATMPDGAPTEVPGLGVCENRVEKEVTEEQVSLHEQQGFTFPEDGRLVLRVGYEEQEAPEDPVLLAPPQQPDQPDQPDDVHTNAGFVGGKEV